MINKIFGILFIMLLINNIGYAEWIQDGGSLNTDQAKVSDYPSVAMLDQVPYVAMREERADGYLRIRVKTNRNGSWEQVGNDLNNYNDTWGSNPILKIIDSTPHVVWYERIQAKIFVKKYNGTAWEALGDTLNVFSNTIGQGPDITEINNVPYVVWSEMENTNWIYQIYVKHYNGVEWVQDGSSLNETVSINAHVPNITVVNNTPYVTWYETDDGSYYRVFVKRFNGSEWVRVGNALNVDSNRKAVDPEITEYDGIPYVAWQEFNGDAEQIYVKYFNGDEWVSLGGSLNIDSVRNAYTPNIIFVGSVPYVTWHENILGGADQLVVKYYNGSAWVQEGGALNYDTEYNANFGYLAPEDNLNLYLTWHELNASGISQVYVKHLQINPFISGFYPNHAIPNQTIKMTISGTNFTNPLLIQLERAEGPEEITAYNVNILNENLVQCHFDLNNSIQGKYNLSVQNTKGVGIRQNSFFTLGEVVSPSAWFVRDISQTGTSVVSGMFSGLSIGDGDNNGTQDIFSACRARSIYKTLEDSGSWNTAALPQGGVGEYYTDVLVCDANHDSEYEVYAVAIDHHLYQFSGSLWQKQDIGVTGDMLYALSAGDGKNEGRTRIYAACADGNIYEFYKSFEWETTNLGGGSGEMYAVEVGDGNNDEQFEVYATSQDRNVYQYKYNGTSWQKTSIGTGSDEMRCVRVVDADRDGSQEVYASGGDGKIYQYKWMLSNWTSVEIASLGSKVYAFEYSDPENSGTNAFYAACDNGHVYQVKWQSGQWNKQDLGGTGVALYDLAIGDADNDNIFEIYALGQDNHIYQFELRSFNPTPTPIPGFKGKIISKKYIYAAPNPIRGHTANIHIYTKQPAEVSAKLFTTSNQEVLSFRRNYGVGMNVERINMSNLANGVYLLLVKAKSAAGTEERVIKKLALVK